MKAEGSSAPGQKNGASFAIEASEIPLDPTAIQPPHDILSCGFCFLPKFGQTKVFLLSPNHPEPVDGSGNRTF